MKLPEGWEWVSLDEVRPDDAPIIYGILQPRLDIDGGIRYVRPTEIVNDHIDVANLRRTTPEIANRYKRAALLANDIVFSIVGSIGKVAIVPPKLAGANITQSSARIRPNSKLIEPLYLKRAMKAPLFVKQCDDYQLGSAVPRLNLEDVRKLRVPLAPLNEQRRIVAKLEKLFSHVDTAQARLATIPRILKRFRQSVLAAACSGRLTTDWREKNAVNIEEWSNIILKDVASLRLGKMLDQAKNIGEPTPYLRNINVRWFAFDLNDLALIKATDEDRQELSIRNGDLLICEGGEPGRCAVWRQGEPNLIYQKAIHRARLNKNVSPYWLAINIKNDADSGELENYFTGSTIKHLTGQSLAGYKFILPSLAEQQEIVRRVEALFKTADALEARYRKAKAHVDKLTQSILARAFRGELVTTEAELARQEGRDYEPASVLLERIRQERAQQQTTLKQRTKRTSKTRRKQGSATKVMF
jgi:type I restriction enzyme S subunit